MGTFLEITYGKHPYMGIIGNNLKKTSIWDEIILTLNSLVERRNQYLMTSIFRIIKIKYTINITCNSVYRGQPLLSPICREKWQTNMAIHDKHTTNEKIFVKNYCDSIPIRNLCFTWILYLKMGRLPNLSLVMDCKIVSKHNCICTSQWKK
jgi:hypothetical protein